MKDDGGTAFPATRLERNPLFDSLCAGDQPKFVPVEHGGMSLRDYFAAHAPDVKWKHFHPTMPPRPEPDWGDIPASQRADLDPINWAEIEQWKADESREYELQWPYFYADAMLKARGSSVTE